MGSVYLYLISFDFYFLFQYEIFKHLLLGKEKTTKILILKQKYLEHSNRVLFLSLENLHNFLFEFFPSFLSWCVRFCSLNTCLNFYQIILFALIVTEDNLMLFLLCERGDNNGVNTSVPSVPC